MFHSYFFVTASGPVAAAGGALAALQMDTMSVRMDVDSKAMRKLRTEDVIFAAIEVVEEGVVIARFNFRSRLLVMLA